MQTPFRCFNSSPEVIRLAVMMYTRYPLSLRQIDDLEPRLTRYVYDVKSIAEEFRAKPAEVRLFLQGQPDPARTRELTEQMLVAGLPV